MKSRFAVSVLAVLVAGLIGDVDVAVCLETDSSITMDVVLNDDQYLFVHGQRLTSVSLRFDRSSEELVVNGILIRDQLRDVSPVSELELLERAEAFSDDIYKKYEETDRFKSEKAAGLGRFEAVKAVKFVEFEINKLVSQWIRSHPDFEGAQEFVGDLRIKYESEGVLREVEYADSGIWVWLQSKSFATKFRAPRPVVQKKVSPVLSVARGIQSFTSFRSEGPKVLIVTTNGTTRFLAGKPAVEALRQIEASIESGSYEEGICGNALIADFLK